MKKVDKRSVLNIDTGYFYESITLAALDVNRCVSSLWQCLKRDTKTAGGYRWAYCDENGNILKEK